MLEDSRVPHSGEGLRSFLRLDDRQRRVGAGKGKAVRPGVTVKLKIIETALSA
jgi:hypothetical protein